MKILILLLCSNFAVAQSVFKSQMDVIETTHSGETFCYEDITVVWGNNGDTLAFHFNDKTYKFWPISKRQPDDYIIEKKIKLMKNHRSAEKMVMLTDKTDERWLFKTIFDKEGFSVYLYNISYGKPYILFDHTSSKICP